MAANESIKREIAALFGRAAADYDQVGPLMFGYFGRRLAEASAPPPGGQVLDVATGKGAALFPALEAVGSQGRVVGIDLSPEMVAQAQQELQRRGVSNAEVRVMDGEQLDFPTGCFDTVLCGLTIFLFPDPEQAFRGYYRVLRPGGRVGVSIWQRQDPQWSWFNDLINAYRSRLPDLDGPLGKPMPSVRLNRLDDLHSLMEKVGFTALQDHPADIELVYKDEEQWWAVQWSHWVRNTLEWLEQAGGPETLARFKQEAFEKMQPLRRPDGFHQVLGIVSCVGKK
jgi:ubiquinone/menaquinone biosynthesis C-methylase UbiE